jgi:hypothetical protein
MGELDGTISPDGIRHGRSYGGTVFTDREEQREGTKELLEHVGYMLA